MIAVGMVGIGALGALSFTIIGERRWAVCGLSLLVVCAQGYLVVTAPGQLQLPQLGLTLAISGVSKAFLLTLYLGFAAQFLYASTFPLDRAFHSLALAFSATITAAILLSNQLALAGLVLVVGLAISVYGLGRRCASAGDLDAVMSMLIAAAVAAVAFLVCVLLIDVYESTHDPGAIRIVAAALSVATGTLMAVFPFHFWLTRLADLAPPMVTAWLAGYSGAAMAILIVASTEAYPWLHSSERVVELVRWGGVVAAVVGAALALGTKRLDRLSVYAGISAMGVLVLGTACTSAVGLVGTTYLALNHVLCVLLLFMSVGLSSVAPSNGETGAPGVPGLARAGLLAGGLAIAGLPPFGGFAGRWLVYEAALSHDPLLVAGSLLSSLLVMAAFVRTLLGSRRCAEPLPGASSGSMPALAMSLVTLALLVMGVYPSPLLSVIAETILTFPGLG